MADSVVGAADRFTSRQVMDSAKPLVDAICDAFDEKYEDIFKNSHHVKTIQDIINFMRKGSVNNKVTLQGYKTLLRKMYEGCKDADEYMAHVDTIAQHFVQPDGLLDVNDLLGSVLMLYSKIDLKEKVNILFKTFDANDDGKISREEMSASLKHFFMQFGGLLEAGVKYPKEYGFKITGDYSAYLPGLRRVFSLEKVDTLVSKAFAAADADKDGFISREEWFAWTQNEGALTQEWGSVGTVLSRHN